MKSHPALFEVVLVVAAGLLALVLLGGRAFAHASAAQSPGKLPAATPRADQTNLTIFTQTGVGYQIVRVSYQDQAQLNRLASWIEPWEVDRAQRTVLVGLTGYELQRLRAEGYEFEILPDPQGSRPVIQAQLAAEAGIPGFPCYRTLQETYDRAAELAQTNPNLAAWIDIGDSWEKLNQAGGSDLRVLKLTNQNVSGPKPVFFVMSGIHARELAPVELSLRFAEYLLANYSTDPDVHWLLDYTEIHLLLEANPDGRQIVESGTNEFWRKNTNAGYCAMYPSSRGADLNRNFSFHWACCGGSSSVECSDTYQGPRPASEPETAAVEQYLRSIYADRREPALDAPAPPDTTGIFLDLHSYSELVLWPWGFVDSAAPNGEALQTLGRRLAYFNDYDPLQSVDLYLTDGTTDDFAYGELGVAAFAFEIGTWFLESCNSFEAQVLPDNLPALLLAARAAPAPYLYPAGPEVTSLKVSSETVEPGEMLTITAVLDDTRYNQTTGTEPVQAVSSGAVYLDVPPWMAGAAPIGQFEPVDGVWDAPQESVQLIWESSGVPEGRHLLFAQGVDADGHVGIVSAVFVQLADIQANFQSTSPDLLGETTVFTNTTAGSVSALLWDFGDGSKQADEPLISHTYPAYGAYTVTLSVTGTHTADQIQQPIYIQVPWSQLTPILSDQPPASDNPIP
ncbi:MAG: M14 family zinc carboxypeptidase [Anaerolineales bacterium]